MAALHPQARAVLDDRAPGLDTLEGQRADYVRASERYGGDAEPVAEVTAHEIPGPGGAIPARAYRPAAVAEPGLLIWLHGGAWIWGDLDGFDRVARSLANGSGAICLTVDYRLAPEHRFPAALEDARATVAWAAGDGATRMGSDPERIVLGGDSSGGNLAAAAALHESGLLRAQQLVYPVTDARMAGASFDEVTPGGLTREGLQIAWAQYLDGADGESPDASPLRAVDLSGVCPALIAIADHDVLRDDGLAYARALADAGVEVVLERYDDMPHGFLRWGGVVDRGRELVARLGAHARAALA